MKTIRFLAAFIFLAASPSVFLGWIPSANASDTEAKQNVIVLLKFKAQQDKGDHAVSELTDLLEKVKEEPHFVSIKLHLDPNDPTSILLYEEWEDASYYNNDHMNTEHLQAFMANSESFLAGPPEITFWEVKNVFE